MNIFWEMYQQGRISSVESSAMRSEDKASDATRTVQYFQDRFDKLILINMALWSLLKQETNLTEEDLLERIKEIDLSDGVLDGKIRQTAIQCPQCGRTMSNKHRTCLYCGYAKEGAGAFDAVT